MTEWLESLHVTDAVEGARLTREQRDDHGQGPAVLAADQAPLRVQGFLKLLDKAPLRIYVRA
jgi:hypothetical protein